jgi:hypothetical protein
MDSYRFVQMRLKQLKSWITSLGFDSCYINDLVLLGSGKASVVVSFIYSLFSGVFCSSFYSSSSFDALSISSFIPSSTFPSSTVVINDSDNIASPISPVSISKVYIDKLAPFSLLN